MGMLNKYNLINGIFCATCLMSKARNRRRLRAAIEHYLKPSPDGRHGLKFSYCEPKVHDIEHNRQLLRLLEFADDPSQPRTSDRPALVC